MRASLLKKQAALLLTVLMVLSVLPGAAVSEEEDPGVVEVTGYVTVQEEAAPEAEASEEAPAEAPAEAETPAEEEAAEEKAEPEETPEEETPAEPETNTGRSRRYSEGEAVWTADFKDLELTGDLRADALAIAETQLDYRESRSHYVIDENGKKKGYTRYGDWAGHPYDEWCADFCSFCLYYAGAEEAGFPLSRGCGNWFDLLQTSGHYRAKYKYTPEPGDLVFFKESHVGFFYEGSGKYFTCLEGNSYSRVRICQHSTDEVLFYAKVG